MQRLIQIMQLYKLTKKILSNSLIYFLIFFSQGYAAVEKNIGNIIEVSGTNGITSIDGVTKVGTKDLDIYFRDTIETVQGKMKIDFVDETKLSLTEHSKVLIDEYYFDPNPSKSKMTMSFVQGTARFATGKLGLVPKENIIINTPTAVVGVRGTDFTTTVDELGRSLIILLPDEECTIDGDCNPSGEITVTNAGGVVTLTEAYSATMVTSFDNAPMQPVILENITINIIDNMFIVTPPNEIEQSIEEEESNNRPSYDLLDFNDLDINLLSEDWDEEDLSINEVDINYLDGDFLQNILDDLLLQQDYLKESSQSTSYNIQGTEIGFDSQTNYYTFIDIGEGTIRFYRIVGGIINIVTKIDSNITLDTENDGKKNFITNGDGQSVVLTIRQGN